MDVSIPCRGSRGPLHLLTDGSGITVEGGGEWNARKHGGPKRRVWRKIRLGIAGKTLEIRAVELTGSDIGDTPMLPLVARPDPARPRHRQRPRRWRTRNPQVPRCHCRLLCCGQRLTARDVDRQLAAFHLRVSVMKVYTALGKPVAEVVGCLCRESGKSGRQAICAIKQ
jgi:hypothetical protein